MHANLLENLHLTQENLIPTKVATFKGSMDQPQGYGIMLN